MNRQEKINYLKDLASGKVPKIPLSEREAWLIDSTTATNMKTGKVIPLKKFEAITKGHNKVIFR